MAIGKVNAYATVEAPKADFGAVAQLNIDNLVKSAKEDEQLKAAKKAAEDKAKQERVKDLGIFPDMTATGATGADSSNIRQASEGLKMWNEYNRDWVENGNYDSKAKAAALINHYKNLNNQMSELQKGAANFGTLAGSDKVNPKDKAYTMDLLKSSENGLTQFGFDKDTNPKVGIYKMSEDGTTKEFVKSMDYNEYYKNIFTPVANIDISAKANDAKNSFEKSLTEQFPGLIKTGIKELSKDTKDAIYKMALSEVENDQFMYVAGDKYNVIAKDDYKKSGFGPKDKEKVARAYANEIIGKFGIDKEITKIQPSKGDGDGGKKDELGTVTVEADSAVRDLKLTGLSSFTGDKEFTVPPNSMSYAIQPLNLKDTSKLNSVKGGKSGFATTPTSFVVTPEGKAYVVSNTAATEGYNVGVASGSGKVQSETFIIPFGTPEFKEAVSGFVNLQPTLEFQGKKYKIKSSRDIYNYLSELEKGFNQRALPALKVSVGGSKVNEKKETPAERAIRIASGK